MRKRQSQVPQRQLKWKKYDYLRNKENRTFYGCQCGKKYSNFSAIYLHFQRKHNRKIQNLYDPSEYQRITNQNQTIYLFFVKNFKSHTNNLKHQIFLDEISEIFCKFQDSYCHFLSEKGLSILAARLFVKFSQYLYVTELKKYSEPVDTLNIVGQLPNKFNDFVQGKWIKEECFQDYKRICQILFLFSQWLNLNNYTELIIQMAIYESLGQDKINANC